MKKLKIEELAVESFVTSEERRERGTVRANEYTSGCTGYEPTCPGFYTCVSGCDTCWVCSG